MSADAYDVIIVGAGPAGLSAALVLGRCRERVLVLDDGQPRNKRSRSVHGFYTRDGTPPETLRAEALQQLQPYDVQVESVHVAEVRRCDDRFEVASDHHRWIGRKLLLATGLYEIDSQIPGVADNIGAGVFCCPYCDGWEVRDLSLGGLVTGAGAAEFGLALLSWSARVTLFTNGEAPLKEDERARLARNRVKVVENPIVRVLEGHAGRLKGLQLDDGSRVEVDALFLHAGQHQHSTLAHALGCEAADEATIKTRGHQHTNVPGVYVAGDAAAHVNSIAIAVADGYKAALAIHTELRRERT
jgi:thioredoxin reductase